jgi:hypothetical protein
MLQTLPHDGFNKKKLKMQATDNQTQKLHCQDITSRVKKMQMNFPQAENSFKYVDKERDKCFRNRLGARGRRGVEDKCTQSFGR